MLQMPQFSSFTSQLHFATPCHLQAGVSSHCSHAQAAHSLLDLHCERHLPMCLRWGRDEWIMFSNPWDPMSLAREITAVAVGH